MVFPNIRSIPQQLAIKVFHHNTLPGLGFGYGLEFMKGLGIGILEGLGLLEG